MTIIHAIYSKTNKKMTVREVAEHKDHSEIKQHLVCSTEGCNAKISFVLGGAGRDDHFRRYRHSEHGSHCTEIRKEEERQKKIVNSEVIKGKLDEKGRKQRIRYLFNKINKPKKSVSERTKKAKRKVSTPNTEAVPGTTVVLGDSSATPINELKSSGTNINVRVPSRELNQISEADEGTFMLISAPVEKMNQTKTGFSLDLCSGTKRAKLVVNESFIKGSKDVGVIDYLKTLLEFVNKQSNNYTISAYAFCMFDEFKGNDTVITASNFDEFFVSVSGVRPVPLKLDTFQAMYITGVW